MTAAYLDEVATIENDCFSHPWSRRSLESELQNETSRFLVAVEDGRVIALVRELVTFCQKRNYAFLTLEVRESNAPAISLYSRFGFVRVGERKNYYSKPVENALLMTKYF